MPTLPCPTEHEEQCALMDWVHLNSARDRRLSLLYANPNGGHRHIGVARKLKAEGSKPGVPDLFLPVASNGYHGLYIEMKRLRGGTVSPEQKEFIELLREQGYRVEVCKGWEKAMEAIAQYLALTQSAHL